MRETDETVSHDCKGFTAEHVARSRDEGVDDQGLDRNEIQGGQLAIYPSDIGRSITSKPAGASIPKASKPVVGKTHAHVRVTSGDLGHCNCWVREGDGRARRISIRRVPSPHSAER